MTNTVSNAPVVGVQIRQPIAAQDSSSTRGLTGAADVLDALRSYLRQAGIQISTERGKWNSVAGQVAIVTGEAEANSWTAQAHQYDAQASHALGTIILASLAAAVTLVGTIGAAKEKYSEVKSNSGFKSIEERLDRLADSRVLAVRGSGPTPSVDKFKNLASSADPLSFVAPNNVAESKANMNLSREQVVNEGQKRSAWFEAIAKQGRSLQNLGGVPNDVLLANRMADAKTAKAAADAAHLLYEQSSNSVEQVQNTLKAVAEKITSSNQELLSHQNSWLDAMTTV